MSYTWYYVEDGQRQGPVGHEELLDFIKAGKLGQGDFVWRKGLEDWKKIEAMPELDLSQGLDDQVTEEPQEVLKLQSVLDGKKAFFIRTGPDREGVPTDYGPFSLALLIKLFDEKRINGKTLVYFQGLNNWVSLGEVPDFEEVFKSLPPQINEEEKRSAKRKPFVARTFFHDNKELYEGICRDISVGGMQVLVDGFPGSVGSEISLNVHPENSEYHFTASGKIVRFLEGNQGFSFRFSSLSDEAREAIENYIKKESA